MYIDVILIIITINENYISTFKYAQVSDGVKFRTFSKCEFKCCMTEDWYSWLLAIKYKQHEVMEKLPCTLW